MNLHVRPGTALRGKIDLPGDKSLSHRAALFAAIADGESKIDKFLVAGVTEVMLGCLSALGVNWRLEGNTLYVSGKGLSGLTSPEAPLFCGNSATTLRLLAGVLGAAGIPAILDGTPGLRSRPMNRIVSPLQQMGVNVSAAGGGAPLEFHPTTGRLKGIDHTLSVASAQVKSCLLLAGLRAESEIILREPALSRDHTERLLRKSGIEVWSDQAPTRDGANEYITRMRPPDELHLSPLNVSLPADISAAAFLLVAALITPGSELVICDVSTNPTRTGLLDVLAEMGANLRVETKPDQGGEPVGDLVVQASSLHGIEVSGPTVVRMIDEFPAFAVAAAFAQGVTVVRDAEELRYKESDRIQAVCCQLRQLGADIQETRDGFILHGGELRGGLVQAEGDHRLAMSLAVAGLASRDEVSVRGAEIFRESFPGFLDALTALGAEIWAEE